MSLINEALKKAQQVQTEAASVVATPASSSLSSTPTATGSGQSDILKVLLGVMIFTIIIGSFIAFLVISIMDRNSKGGQIVVVPQQPESVTSAQQSSLTNNMDGGQSQATVSDKRDSIASHSIDSSQSDVSDDKTNVRASQTGKTLASSPSSELNGVNPRSITSVAPTSSFETQTQSSNPISIAHNSLSIDGDRDKPNPACIAYVKDMQIQGIRISDRNSKILMGNKVFGVESMINNELNLRVKEIKPREVILIDDDGLIYSKQF